MGYRFTLDSANTVANLSFGKVMSCYRDIYSSEENFYGFMYFLDQFHQNMYSNEIDRYMKKIRRIQKTLYRYEDFKWLFEDVEYEDPFLHFHRDALGALHELSEIFERCTVKSLLLPEIINNNKYDYDDFMTSQETLHKLVRTHQGDSCLILQPQERPYRTTIFDAFPNFEVALRQADMWPAVLFWDGNDFAFVPVRHKDELFYLFEIIQYERHPLGEIKRIAEKKKKTSHYIFQLSDLHFGAKNVDIAERRLKSLVKFQLSNIELQDSVDFVITGDAVDSPSRATENDYINFAEYLEERCGHKPIRILGNHDINKNGLAVFHGKQRIANIIGEYPKIHILEEQKSDIAAI